MAADGEAQIVHRRSGLALKPTAAQDDTPPTIISMIAGGKSIEHMAAAYTVSVEQMRAMIKARPDVEELYQKIYETADASVGTPTMPAPPSTPPPESPTTENTETPPQAPPLTAPSPATAAASPSPTPAPGPAIAVRAGGRRVRVAAPVAVDKPASAPQAPVPPRPQEGLVGLVPPADERRLPVPEVAAVATMRVNVKTTTMTVEDVNRYVALGRLYEAAHAVGIGVDDLVDLVRKAFPK